MTERRALQTSGGMQDFKKFLPFITSNWWIVVLAVSLSGGLGWLYVYKLEKVYAVSTQLLLKSNQDYSAGSLITDSKYFGNVGRTYIDNSNEIRVIKSKDLIERALERLDLDVSYFLVGRLRTTEVYSGVPFSVKVMSLHSSLYEQDMRFLITSPTSFTLTYLMDQTENTVKGKFNEELISPHFRLMVTSRVNIKDKLTGPNQANYLIRPHRLDFLTSGVVSRLTVENPEYTNILKIS